MPAILINILIPEFARASCIGRPDRYAFFRVGPIYVRENRIDAEDFSLLASLMKSQSSDEPGEAEHADKAHHERHTKSLAAQCRSRVTGNTLPVRHGCVWLGGIKSKGEPRVDAQVAGFRCVAHLGIRVLHNEGVELGQQGIVVVVRLLAGIPGEVGAGSEGHVGGEDPGRASLGATGDDINSRRCAPERRVVPSPFDLVADLVERS